MRKKNSELYRRTRRIRGVYQD